MSCRANPLNIQPSILPFLFEPRSLPSRPVQNLQTRPFPKPCCRRFSTTKRSIADLEDRNIDEYSADNAENPQFRGIKFYASTAPALSYPEKTFHFRPTKSDHLPPPSRPYYDSTMTTSEQAVFDRIFADISSYSPSEDSGNVEAVDETDSFADLDTIFNNAIGENQNRTERIEERRAALGVSRPTPTGHGIDVYSLGLRTTEAGWDQPGKIGSDDVSIAGTAHFEYRRKLDDMLEKANTDVEMWQVLEDEVFSLVRELNARIKKAERTSQKSRSRKASKAQTAVASPPPPSEENKVATQKPATGKIPYISKPLPPASLPPTVLLSILKEEYPEYLLKTLRLFRNVFPTSTFGLHVLPTVRRLGPISYVLGASTALYNETLLLMWKQEGNLLAIADMLEEMRKQGVESDHVTLALLVRLGQIRNIELAGHRGKWRKMWWGMGNGLEGWQRVAQQLQRCREEVKAKEAEEMAKEAEMLGEEKELDDAEQKRAMEE